MAKRRRAKVHRTYTWRTAALLTAIAVLCLFGLQTLAMAMEDATAPPLLEADCAPPETEELSTVPEDTFVVDELPLAAELPPAIEEEAPEAEPSPLPVEQPSPQPGEQPVAELPPAAGSAISGRVASHSSEGIAVMLYRYTQEGWQEAGRTHPANTSGRYQFFPLDMGWYKVAAESEDIGDWLPARHEQPPYDEAVRQQLLETLPERSRVCF